MINLIAFATFVIVAAILLSPRVRASDAWCATATPLASIIGSGFLISLPLLTIVAGSYAVFPMLLLIALSYALGSVLRFNIAHGEPLFDAKKPKSLLILERLGHVVLAFAYFISVTYYITLLTAFVLKGFGIVDPDLGRMLTTAVLVFIGVYGFWRGLHKLEALEEYTVGLKLAVIAAVLVSLLIFNAELLIKWQWPSFAQGPPFTWHSTGVILGLLIVVQGFETSRFLKGVYPPSLRIRTMRNAQLISGAIYIGFFALSATVVDVHFNRVDIAAVTTFLQGIATILPMMLIGGAVFAQASAAIADSIGSAGLLFEISGKKLTRARAYLLIALVGVLLTWLVNVFHIIALASRAFALFYALECVVAVVVAWVAPDVKARKVRVIWYGALFLVALTVVIFGIPADTAG